MSFQRELPLSSRDIARCRTIAKSIGEEVTSLVKTRSSVGVERAVLRLLGFNDAIGQGKLFYPVANQIVDQLKKADRLHEGVLLPIFNVLHRNQWTIDRLQVEIVENNFDLSSIPLADRPRLEKVASVGTKRAIESLRSRRKDRAKIRKRQKDPVLEKRPLKYVIVATGNIFEDVTQAKSAALDGADIIAVIRSTAQSLLDYVPHGTTTEGFGGTYATQANFALMRSALDEIGDQVGRYIRLTNYSSGLCMSEIAALGAIEGLDCLLNDAMYGLLFRDINMRRTLIDQHFSRAICALAGIWIMTGEDNYMKTTDAAESGDQVLASQFINERTALNAGVKPENMAIGHAMEMDPFYSKVISMEIARAKMTKQIFPDCPLKYMCNTKYKTGDIFFSHAVDAVFNFIGSLTGQGTILLGMPTEAIHTPWLQDRSMSIRNANYLVNGGLGLENEIGYRTDGFIAGFAKNVLGDAVKLLTRIQKKGLYRALEERCFAGVSRHVDGGKGADGVFEIDKKTYFNPVAKLLGSKV